MSFHTGQSFTFGETPSATKWNYLWENDYALADGTGLEDDIIDSRHYVDGSIDYVHLGADVGAFEVLADVTLGGAADSISSGTFTARKYLKFFCHTIPSGNIIPVMRFNNDSGSNYSHRYQLDNTVGGNGVSQSNIGNFSGSGAFFVDIYGEVQNFTSQVKNGIFQATSGNNSAGTAPSYVQFFGKWANTSAQITRLDIINTDSGDFASGTRLLVLGRD